MSLHFRVFKPLVYLIVSLLTLCSFVAVPTVIEEKQPPLEAKNRQKSSQKRFNKRYNRLHRHLNSTTKAKKRSRIQKKLHKMELEQDISGSPIFGALGLGLGVGAAVLMFANIYWAIPSLPLIGIVFAIAGFILSICAIVFHRKNPEKYPLAGLGITGVIICSIMILISMLVLLVMLVL